MDSLNTVKDTIVSAMNTLDTKQKDKITTDENEEEIDEDEDIDEDENEDNDGDNEDENDEENEDENDEENDENDEDEEENDEDEEDNEEEEEEEDMDNSVDHIDKNNKEKATNNKILKAKLKSNIINIDDELFEDESDDGDYNVDDFDENIEYKEFQTDHVNDYIQYNYPEKQQCSLEEMYELLDVKRNKQNVIYDPNHTTIPILTKYERSRILGTRAAQLNDGSEPYIKIPSHIVDSYVIAEKELKEKALPFIISRPLPNGRIEYWRLSDLEILHE